MRHQKLGQYAILIYLHQIFSKYSYQFWKQNEEKTRPILNPIREETWAIGLRREDEALLVEVNAFLKSYREAGKFDELGLQYMAEQKAAFESMGVPFIFH